MDILYRCQSIIYWSLVAEYLEYASDDRDEYEVRRVTLMVMAGTIN